MALGIAIVVSATGCDLVFGLSGRVPADAPSDIADAPIDRPIDVPEATCIQDPSQPDEDGDGFPNSCDNCPHIAQTDQSDTDHDTVGDKCDPRDAQPDKILYFDGFDTLPSGLDLLPTGRWKIENGQLVAYNIPPLPMGDTIARTQGKFGNAQIITRLTLLVSDGDPESAGVWARIGAPTPPASTVEYPPGVIFEVLRSVSGLTRRCHLWETWQGVRPEVQCAQDPKLFQPQEPYTMSLDCISGRTPECRGVIAHDIGGAHTEVPIDWADATEEMGPMGLRVYAVDTAFDYIVIIGHE